MTIYYHSAPYELNEIYDEDEKSCTVHRQTRWENFKYLVFLILYSQVT